MKYNNLTVFRGLAGFNCPSCGSSNTGQSTYADWCNNCNWSQGY